MKKLLSAIVALTLLLSCVLPGALAEVDKKEMVYVLADADGSVNDVIVSEIDLGQIAPQRMGLPYLRDYNRTLIARQFAK